MLGLTNGNMTTRTISGSTYTLGYDEENHLTSVSGAAMASFVYDGDGKRVKGTVNGVTTSYIGDYFEWSPSTENLVANPGFETTGNWTETTITGFASTWFFRSTWGTADQHSGTYGYAISNQMYGYLRSQEIAVSPGQYYDVNAYMRGLIDPEDSFGSVLVRASFYTSGGAAVSNVDAATVSPGSLTTTWQKLGGVVQVPATAAKLYLQLFTYHNTGWVTFDDAEVYLSDAQGNHTGSNLVANPGFETTSGWTRVPSTSYPATTFARSNDTGTLMKGRSGYGHSISNLAWGEIYTSGFIPTTAGKQYDLYAWVRGELDSDANFGNYQLRLAFYDSAGNPVSSLNSYTGDPASISSTWANRGGRVTVPAGVTQMKVLLRVDEVSGWVDFDDVELYEVVGGQRTGGNLAPDPGFETGAGWATTATFPNSTSFFRSTWGTADQHSGSYGWVISNHMYGTLTSDSIAVTAGETYQVSAYLRGELDAEDSGGAWLIRVSYYNAGGTRINYHDVYTNSNNSFTGWQEKGDLTVAPAGAVSMTVAVWNYMNSSWIGFDDVRVTAVSMKKYYYAGGQRVAMREGAGTGVTGLSFLFGDHLGSTSVTANSSGTKTAEVRYKAWGEDRYTSGTLPTRYTYTGQYRDSYINLYWYGSRWYDAELGRFISPDPIITEPYNPLAYDRYQYVYSNPVRYTDSSGHCIDGMSTWICIALLLKAVDYGWTAWDTYQSSRVLANPDASRGDKLLASLNIGLAVLFEAGEPDDLIPAGLPLDDVGRRAAMKGAREAFEAGGESALEKYLRDNLGGYADDVIEKLGLGIKAKANDLSHIFNNPRHHLDNLVNAFGGNQQSTYNAVWREFSKVAENYSAKELRQGVQITVNGISLTVRGAVVDGVAQIGTFFVP